MSECVVNDSFKQINITQMKLLYKRSFHIRYTHVQYLELTVNCFNVSVTSVYCMMFSVSGHVYST